MNNAQKITLALALANLVLVSLFPPYDYAALTRENIPTFDGFYFYFDAHFNRQINTSFLTLEIIVVLINASIAWLLFRNPPVSQRKQAGSNRAQRRVLALVALNLFVVLVFPPFENYAAITKAALPTFEGFYFVLADNTHRQLVSAILYIEVALVLINGGLLWLLFKDKGAEELSAEQMRAMAQHIRKAQKR